MMKYICAFIGAMMLLCMNVSYANCGDGCPKVMIFAEVKSISDGNARVEVKHAAYDTEMPYHHSSNENKRKKCVVKSGHCLDPSQDRDKDWIDFRYFTEKGKKGNDNLYQYFLPKGNGVQYNPGDHVIIIQHINTGTVLKRQKAKDYFKSLYKTKIGNFNVSFVSVDKKNNKQQVQYRIRFTKDKVELNPKESDLDRISDINNKNTGDNADKWIVIAPKNKKLKNKNFRLHDLLQHRR
jgi:hypothetical protein